MRRVARWALRTLSGSLFASITVGFVAMQLATRPPRWLAILVAYAGGAAAAAYDARVRRFAPVAACRAVIGRGEHGAVRIVHAELHRLRDSDGSCTKVLCPYAVDAVEIALALGLVKTPSGP